LRVVAELPDAIACQALNYVALFRPSSGRGLSWARAKKLLGELKALVQAGTVQWKGQVARPASPGMWARGMESMIECPPRKLPLKSHGYLQAMVYDIADMEDRGAEKQLRAAERNGRVPGQEAKRMQGGEDNKDLKPFGGVDLKEIKQFANSLKSRGKEPGSVDGGK
jgi:hypothetical protein